MRIIYKFQSTQITQETDLSKQISEIKLEISSRSGIDPSSILFFIQTPTSKIELQDSILLSSLNPSENFTIFVETIGKSPITRQKSRRTSYLESLGLDESLPTRYSNPLQEAIEACKRGSLRDLSRIIEIFEQTNPGEIDLMHHSNENLWTPLHYASYYGRDDIVRYLISRMVNVNSVTIDEWTPLQLASYRLHLNCVKELVSYLNLQINKMTRYRGTALHLACEVENVEIVEILLKYGAYVSLVDCENDTAFDKTHNDEILRMLAAAMGTEEGKKKENKPPVSRVDEVFISNALDIHGRSVVVHLDAQAQEFKRYLNMAQFSKRAEPEFVMNLRDVQNVHTEFYKSTKEYYFVVENEFATDRYYTSNKEFTTEWANELKNAANYCMTQNTSRERAVTKIERPQKKEQVENHTVSTSSPISEVINFESFTLLEELGKGSFGIVYKVCKKNTSEIFAMKCLSKTALKKQRQLKYAISECKIMKQLKHPFVLLMQFAFQTTQSLYMVLDYCPNGDLLNLIEKYGKISEAVSGFYTAETILALEYLHSLDIVYRDLKPANILLGHDMHVKLADFGLAKEDITNTPAMTMAGSPAYLPPEIVERRGASTASDIYGVGVLLYELLTGNLPYYNPDIELLFDSIVKDTIIFPSYLSAEAVDLIRNLMQKGPEKRLTIPEIKQHPFFRGIDWNDLLKKNLNPPQMIIT